MASSKKKLPPFVPITKEMIRSKAWEKLSHYSVRAYIHVAAKYNGKNENNLSFTYKEASKIMNTHTYKKAIDELVRYGFLDMKRSGACYGKCNIFGLSERWKKYDTPEFREGKRKVIKQNPMKLSE